MRLNRKARRAQKNRRPYSEDSPKDQMKAFLKQPGKFHIVQLPENKSFVVKVTEAEMPLFLTICGQLKGVLGFCEAIPATPVEASVADTQMIAADSAQASKRIREARQRQDLASAAAADAERGLKAQRDELAEARQRRDADLDASVSRHPAGRHRKPEPETTFDRLLAVGPATGEDAQRRAAALEIAAAQDAVARAQVELDRANEAYGDAVERGGELHNRAVLDRMSARAGEAIERNIGNCPVHHPNADPNNTKPCSCGADGYGEFEPGYGPFGVDGPIRKEDYELKRYGATCPEDECGWTYTDTDKSTVATQFGQHMMTHAQAVTGSKSASSSGSEQTPESAR